MKTTKGTPVTTRASSLMLASLLLFLPALTRAETAVQAWVQRYNGPAYYGQSFWGLPSPATTVDSSYNVIVTGFSTTSEGGYDYLTIKYSSAGLPLWTNRYNGPGNSADHASAVTVDANNDVIVTGYSGSYPSYDYVTIKYSSGGVPLWTNHYNGGPNVSDVARVVAVDGSNNVIVTGSSGIGELFDYVTIKYSSEGVPLWTNRYNGPGSYGYYYGDYAYAMAVDSSNNVIVTGQSWGSGGTNDYATIQYSSAGVPLWTNRYPAGDGDNAVAVDGSNNVIVTGSSRVGGDTDYVTIKYSSAGVPLWTNRYNGPGNRVDFAHAVAVDGSNNVIVTGYSYGSANNYDYLTIKYSSDGMPLWTNRYQAPGNGATAQAVAVDGSNNVIVTGDSYVGSGGSSAYTTIKYSSAGVPLWTNFYNGPGNDVNHASALVVDHSGNVIVTGWSTNNAGGYDFATIKYICVPEPVLTNLSGTNGTFQMRVDGVLQPGTLVIEASSDLAGWVPVFTNATPTNALFYNDPEADTYLRRFYRAFQFP